MFRDKILSLLQTLPANRQLTEKGSAIWIKCPLHAGGNEKTPSFRIQLDSPFAGSFYCFACSAHSNSWRETCEALGFSGSVKFLTEEYVSSTFSEDEEAFLLGKEIERRSKEFREAWPRYQDWRNIPGQLIKDVGGCMLLGKDGKEPILRLPVNVYKEEKGWIDCKINPAKDDKIKYLNKGGTWAKDVLYPFDYIKELNPNVLILVEGPRDALVSIRNGYSALATLGATSWNSKCADLVLSLAPTTLVLLFDPDDAGEKLRKRVFKDLVDKLNVKQIRLSSKIVVDSDTGKMKRVKLQDPADLSKKQLRKILVKANVI
jgi:DNA primase